MSDKEKELSEEELKAAAGGKQVSQGELGHRDGVLEKPSAIGVMDRLGRRMFAHRTAVGSEGFETQAAHQRMTNANPALIEIVRKFLATKFNYKFK